MTSRTPSVKTFFDNTDVYLRKSFGVSVRSFVVRSLLGELEGSAILDLGCGDGSISLQYLSPTNRITLVDLSGKMLERAKLKTGGPLGRNVEYVNDDFHRITQEENFDVVLCVGVLAHVASVRETVAKVAEFLKPGGYCLLQLTDAEQVIAKIERFWRSKQKTLQSYGYSINRTTPSQIIHMANQSGLSLVAQRRFSLLFPGMGKLPNRWLYRYQMFTFSSRFLSRHGSEVILLFAKE